MSDVDMDADSFSPSGYRKRAAEMREQADKTPGLQTKRAMRNIAVNYEALARWVEKNGHRLHA